jgi:ribosome maturation factor RimP
LEDGVSTEIDGIQIYIDEDGASLQDLQIDATDKLSGKLSRLFNKVTRLENGE